MLERWSGAPLDPDPDERPPGPLERYKLPLAGLFGVVAVLGVALTLARTPIQQPIQLPTPAAGARVLKVHVVGAVARPGVYELHDGDRVEDALAAAGGLRPDADDTRLNLAPRVRDGQQVVVAAQGAPAVQAAAAVQPAAAEARTAPAGAPLPTTARATRVPTPHPGARLNLNRASAAELETLPGVGPVTAQRILQHRTDSGPFAAAEDLRTSRLVTSAVWERIKELIEAP